MKREEYLDDYQDHAERRPKKKKKKHIQMMRSEKTAEAFPSLIQSGDADSRIREAVRRMEERQK